MKRYLILTVALLFASFTITTAQRKIVTDKLQVTSLKNAETIGFDAKGNAVSKSFPEVDLSAIQNALNGKLDAEGYEGTAADLAGMIDNVMGQQSDWEEQDPYSPAYIKNKPDINATGNSGELIKVTENGKTGYHLSSINPEKLLPIGNNSINLSLILFSPGDTEYGASGDNSTIGGGVFNRATGAASVVDGGMGNQATGLNSVIGGGYWCVASGNYSVISGGSENMSSGMFSAVGGGRNNLSQGFASVIGGGRENQAAEEGATVSGGATNSGNGEYSTVSGGSNNKANGLLSTISGGDENKAVGNGSHIGGGSNNEAVGNASSILGGNHNETFGNGSSVLGGFRNKAKSYCEFVVGVFNTDYTPNSTTAFNHNDRLFVIGNGKTGNSRSDALIVYKNGNMDLNGLLKLKPMSAPDSPQKGMIFFDEAENVLKCYDGSQWHNLF